MATRIEQSLQVLETFLGRGSDPALIDRAEVVAHATLSGYAHHWPDRATPRIFELLEATGEIKIVERSRWMTQRRIAIAKLSKELVSP